MNDELIAYVQRKLGEIRDDTRLQTISGWEAVTLLSPLNEIFRPQAAKLATIRYDRAFEAEADEAILRFADAGPDAWSECSASCWRVLLERHRQSLQIAMTNEHADNPLIALPTGLSEGEQRVALVLFLQLRMKLLRPPADPADCRFLDQAPPNLRSH